MQSDSPFYIHNNKWTFEHEHDDECLGDCLNMKCKSQEFIIIHFFTNALAYYYYHHHYYWVNIAAVRIKAFLFSLFLKYNAQQNTFDLWSDLRDILRM